MKPKTELLLGIHSVSSALSQVPGQVQRVLASRETKSGRVGELIAQAQDLGIQVEMLSRREIDNRSGNERNQDVIAEFHPANLHGEKELPDFIRSIDGEALLLILDGVQDPHNLGACLRTASAAGVHAVIIPKDRSVSVTPVVRRAAAGAAEIMPLFSVTNLARVLKELKKAGVWITGTSDQAERDFHSGDLTGPMALVMGSEGSGMRHLTAELCDFQYKIPMAGSVSSLNVSVATGVCLFEICRQRGALSKTDDQ